MGHWTDGVDLYSPYHNQFKVHEDFGGLLRGKIGSVHSFWNLTVTYGLERMWD
ncbi:hypothetical protein SFC43_25615 [Bacteroides sp. CR5/BHMF/2]|nr:hypothetical protein [Bacteroides sp. CR5/BHMF/2]